MGGTRVLVPGHQNSGAPFVPDRLFKLLTLIYAAHSASTVNTAYTVQKALEQKKVVELDTYDMAT